MHHSHRSSPVQIPNQKPKTHSSSKIVTNNTMATPVAVSGDVQYFAYRLGHLSRSRIQREAGKAEPRLHKLIGHCSLFDSARKFILDHMDDGGHHQAEDDEESESEDIEVGEWWEEDVNNHHSRRSSQTTPVKSEESGKGGLIVVTATQIDAEGYVDDLDDIDDIDDLDWDNDSDSTEDGDLEDDDGHWSDSTCEDEDEHVHHPHHKNHHNHHHHSSKVIDIPTMTAKAVADTHYSCSYLARSHNDDQALWAQQPQVLSRIQADNLLLEAFG